MKQLFDSSKPKLTLEIYVGLACVIVTTGFSAFALQIWYLM